MVFFCFFFCFFLEYRPLLDFYFCVIKKRVSMSKNNATKWFHSKLFLTYLTVTCVEFFFPVRSKWSLCLSVGSDRTFLGNFTWQYEYKTFGMFSRTDSRTTHVSSDCLSVCPSVWKTFYVLTILQKSWIIFNKFSTNHD